MAEIADEKLMALARQIAQTLGPNNSATDDILSILSNSDAKPRESFSDDGGGGVDHTLKSLDRRISRYISSAASIWLNPRNSTSFLDAVDQLIVAVREWNPIADRGNISTSLDRAEDLLQQSMYRLEDEFRALIERGWSTSDHSDYSDDDLDDGVSVDGVDFIPVARPMTDYKLVVDALPERTADDLNDIAKRMVAAGYMKECSGVYSTCRRDFLEQSFSRLGLQKLTGDDLQSMKWSQVEDEIEKWSKAITVAAQILFPSELRLCDRVFYGFPSAVDLSFAEVCRDSTIQLLNFADEVAIVSRNPDRLFKLLDVYEAVRDSISQFELIFSRDHSFSLIDEAVAVRRRVGDVIRVIFLELENSIRRDVAKSAIPGGGLHPINRYMMNYLRAACSSRQTLEQVFEESDGKGDEGGLSSLAIQLTWMMELLENNLESKSKLYREDTALCCVFMINNLSYMLQKVKDNEMGAVLGGNWIKKHTAKVKQYRVTYQKSSWCKVLDALSVDNSSHGTTTKILREKLKMFNSYFEETCKTQSTWVIFNEELCEEFTVSVSETVSEAYSGFIRRFGKHGDRHIKYSVEDIEAWIGDLFQGMCSGKR
ncbi:hypothetical protein ACP275_04G085100 [Erythranthe tilingii]